MKIVISAPHYIFICGLSDSTTIFLPYLINGNFFGKGLSNVKCMFWLSL